MIENLHDLLQDVQPPGLNELRMSLAELFAFGAWRFAAQQRLCGRVYRVRLELYGGGHRSVMVKRLDPLVAQRNQLVAQRWLPAVSLAGSGPALLTVAAERHGKCVWHVYEDLGDWGLDPHSADRERITTAV